MHTHVPHSYLTLDTFNVSDGLKSRDQNKYQLYGLHAVAVDVDPAESALLELKIAAIKHLSYEDYVYLLVLGDKEDTMQKRCKMIIMCNYYAVQIGCLRMEF